MKIKPVKQLPLITKKIRQRCTALFFPYGFNGLGGGVCPVSPPGSPGVSLPPLVWKVGELLLEDEPDGQPRPNKRAIIKYHMFQKI